MWKGGAGIESSCKLQNFNWLSNRWLLMSSFQTLVPRSISVQVLKCTPMFCLLAQQTGHESTFEPLVFVQSSLQLISCRNDTSLSYFAQTNATVHPFLCCYEWLPYSPSPKEPLQENTECIHHLQLFISFLCVPFKALLYFKMKEHVRNWRREGGGGEHRTLPTPMTAGSHVKTLSTTVEELKRQQQK